MTDQQRTDQTHQPLGTPDVAPDASSVAVAENSAVTDALAVIDGALTQMLQRELVSSGEVADLLLDVRTLLATSANR